VYCGNINVSDKGEKMSRLVAYGMIVKGRPDRCKLVLLDNRICPDQAGMIHAMRRWCGRLRLALGPNVRH
jgi:hypothetical protein